MSWTNKVKIADDLSVAGTELYSDAVELNSDETAHIQIVADFPAGPTDDLEVRVYTTLDASTETWDNTTFATAQTMDNGTDPNRFSITVTGIYKFRLGFVRSGSTDTITVNAWYKSNGNYRDCSLDI
jgi:hypothetical protein